MRLNLKGALSKSILISKFASQRSWQAWVGQVASATCPTYAGF